MDQHSRQVCISLDFQSLAYIAGDPIILRYGRVLRERLELLARYDLQQWTVERRFDIVVVTKHNRFAPGMQLQFFLSVEIRLVLFYVVF